MPDFLPRRGAELVTWSANFDRTLNANPEAYGVSIQQAELYRQLHQAFAVAFQNANAAATDSTAATVTKMATERTLRDYARVLAGIARVCPLVNDAQLVSLGLRARRKKPTKIHPPRRAPGVRVGNPVGRSIPVRLFDVESPTRRAKPRGAASAMVFTRVGDEPSGSRWLFRKTVSKTNFQIEFPADLPPGTKVWITAQWCSRTGKPSPAAAPMYAHLGYGISKAA